MPRGSETHEEITERAISLFEDFTRQYVLPAIQHTSGNFVLSDQALIAYSMTRNRIAESLANYYSRPDVKCHNVEEQVGNDITIAHITAQAKVAVHAPELSNDQKLRLLKIVSDIGSKIIDKESAKQKELNDHAKYESLNAIGRISGHTERLKKQIKRPDAPKEK